MDYTGTSMHVESARWQDILTFSCAKLKGICCHCSGCSFKYCNRVTWVPVIGALPRAIASGKKKKKEKCSGAAVRQNQLCLDHNLSARVLK